MKNDILIDRATLKSSLRALGLSPLQNDERHLFDIDIANLAKLTEDIVLHENIRYPSYNRNKLSLQSQSDQKEPEYSNKPSIEPDFEPLGSALKPQIIKSEVDSFCAEESREMISGTTTTEGLLDTLS